MTKKSKTIIFFGTDSLSLAALRALVEADYEISLVVTKPDNTKDKKNPENPVKIFARNHNINILQPTNLIDIMPNINEVKQQHSIIGILFSYGKLLPRDIIDSFDEYGIINIHPSLLPKYRGPSPIESAIKNGDDKTGTSIMKLTYEMDAGPIYKQVQISLSGKETRPELYDILGNLSAETLLDTLPRILDDNIEPKPQDESKATYSHIITKSQSWLDFNQLSSKEAYNLIRSQIGFPKTKAIIKQKNVTITSAHISKDRINPTDMECNDDLFIVIDRLIPENSKEMSINDFINGYMKD